MTITLISTETTALPTHLGTPIFSTNEEAQLHLPADNSNYITPLYGIGYALLPKRRIITETPDYTDPAYNRGYSGSGW